VQQPPGNDTGTIVLVVLAVLIVGGAGFYFKIYRPRHEMGGTEDDAEELEEKSPDTDEGTPDEEEDGKDDDSNDENGEE
jgi:flagellar biosynthesis/type III secretory pathway M-ring protein FliF/YscJ